MAVSGLDRDIGAFERTRSDLEARYNGKWVLFYNERLVGVYDTFDLAAKEAVKRFGRGPYLIRQVGAPPIALPASVLFHPVSGKD